jgi:hypothetical protein
MPADEPVVHAASDVVKGVTDATPDTRTTARAEVVVGDEVVVDAESLDDEQPVSTTPREASAAMTVRRCM